MPQQMQRPAYYSVAGAGPAGPNIHGARPRWPAANSVQRIPSSMYPPRGAAAGRHGPPVLNPNRLVSAAAPRPITGPASIPRQPTAARPAPASRQPGFNQAAKPIRPTVSCPLLSRVYPQTLRISQVMLISFLTAGRKKYTRPCLLHHLDLS